jgi:hypothetical protein
LQVVEKGRLVHTIVSQNVTQTFVGWKDIMAMGVISSDWPAMPQQEDTIHAADDNNKEKQLGELKIHMLNKYNTVFSNTINEKPIADPRYFATADCLHGYFQLALDKKSRDLTTFMLPSGRWQYLQGPMGLSATSDNWCRKSDFVIKGNENARKIVDDILCWGQPCRNS